MVLVIQIGLTSQEIPLEGKIIRVADEFDALVSKRQYKSHLGINDTLKILTEEASPSVNKIDPKILKALIKVIIEDTEYEIINLQAYVDYLAENLKRLKQIKLYKEKMDNSRKDSDREYYKQGIIQLFEPGETAENYMQVLADYEQAYSNKLTDLDKLHGELKFIKKVKC